MASRTARAQVAQETLTILETGRYLGPAGQEISIRVGLDSARSRSILYTPARFEAISTGLDEPLANRADRPTTAFEVVNETTLHAARRLLDDDSHTRVLALNFASARNPGGGFLKGSQAQEESLARASGLYACINPHQEMYETNRRFPSCLYTDHMIYSPDVPVFRDDDDRLLERPYPVSILTAPAVNAGAVRSNEPSHSARIEPVMLGRIEKLLSVAVIHGHDALVLGAWGCGVFANDPDLVASWFAQHLAGNGRFRTAFRKVIFAVFDRTSDRAAIRPFERVFTKSG